MVRGQKNGSNNQMANERRVDRGGRNLLHPCSNNDDNSANPDLVIKGARRPQPEQASKSATVTPELLLRTVEAFYADRVIPQASLLQWRLQTDLQTKICAHDLRHTALATPHLYISGMVGAKGLAFSVMLRTKPQGFEGFADETVNEQAISSDLLIEAAIHLLQGGWNKADDPRHDKYEVTSWLQWRSSQLSTLPWGQVLRVVRWFMANSVQVLGKKGNRIVPYPLSDNFDKEENARLLRPTGLRPGEKFVRSWEELVDCLHCLIELGDGWARISELKKNFRLEFQLELTETALGHTTLFSLLMDERCSKTVALEKIDGADAIWLRRARPDEVRVPIQEDVVGDALLPRCGPEMDFVGQLAPHLQQTPSPRGGGGGGAHHLSQCSPLVTSKELETPQKPPPPPPLAQVSILGGSAATTARQPSAVGSACKATPELKQHVCLERQLPPPPPHCCLTPYAGLPPPLPAFASSSASRRPAAVVEVVSDIESGARAQAETVRPGVAVSKVEPPLPRFCKEEVSSVAEPISNGKSRGASAVPYSLPPWCRVQNTFLVASPANAPACVRASSMPPRVSW